MKYKNLQILTIVSIIVGCFIFYNIMGAITTLGYMDTTVFMELGEIVGFERDRVYQNEANIGLWYAVFLTIIVFIVYPILYLRKANKNKQVIIKPSKN